LISTVKSCPWDIKKLEPDIVDDYVVLDLDNAWKIASDDEWEVDSKDVESEEENCSSYGSLNPTTRFSTSTTSFPCEEAIVLAYPGDHREDALISQII
jgi:hypothetical protein